MRRVFIDKREVIKFFVTPSSAYFEHFVILATILNKDSFYNRFLVFVKLYWVDFIFVLMTLNENFILALILLEIGISLLDLFQILL